MRCLKTSQEEEKIPLQKNWKGMPTLIHHHCMRRSKERKRKGEEDGNNVPKIPLIKIERQRQIEIGAEEERDGGRGKEMGNGEMGRGLLRGRKEQSKQQQEKKGGPRTMLEGKDMLA